jgi:hypothetical protein
LPRIRPGKFVEPDYFTPEDGEETTGAVWMPEEPSLALRGDFIHDTFEVRVYDDHQGRLASVVEFVTPAHKASARGRRALAVRCAAHLQERVSLVLVDIVTEPAGNPFAEVLARLGVPETSLLHEAGMLAVACRVTKPVTPEPPRPQASAGGVGQGWRLEVWREAMALGQPLPTLPLWLADDLAVPLNLEGIYEETCDVLRIA